MSKRRPSPAVPDSILIIRLSAIGDIIMASGVLPCLRAAFPAARIAWLTEAGNEELLQANPRLDRVFVWPRRRWREDWKAGRRRAVWREFHQLRQELRGQRFDWILDLQGLLKSALWARLAGGRRRIGLGSKEGSQWLMTEVVDRPTESPLIGKEYRHLMNVLAAAPERFTMDMAVSAEADRHASTLLHGSGVVGPFAVFCPFTTRPQKHWFDERWVELAVRTRREAGLVPVLVGGPGDRERAAAIVQSSAGAAVNLCGRTRLDECAAVIRRAALVVGVDTGMTHMGIAMGRPSVTLLGSTDPYFETGTAHGRVLYHRLPCYPCYRRPTCGGEFTCMRMHTVEGVFDTLQTLLAGAGAVPTDRQEGRS
ncbi:glycosyltransferase family 9 protein [Methylotetracoccus oryzae]|uniref:glycosyltransferase family 9 protein n=1 Tax=Methylotetracoccus oryzae TaxID=1919059 RepID=UPI001119044B|nr:glycosyltransferase family 9 protein [Methylotetracoccus oryzae]